MSRTPTNPVSVASGSGSNEVSQSVENRVLSMWQKFGGSKIGRKLFNIMLSRSVPYTGTIKAEVLELQPGLVKVSLKDRRAVRNHLKSIHAIALANLGELASGLAMVTAVPNGTRSIVTNLDIEYLKKARGQLFAEGRANPPAPINESVEDFAYADISDEAGDVVARVKVLWRLSPREEKV